MTRKQINFCKAYLKCGDEVKAAIEAGYSKNGIHVTACNLLKNIKIKTFLKDKFKNSDENKIMSKDEWLERMTAEARGETTEDRVVIELIGRGISKASIIQVKIPAKDRLKALEKIESRIFDDESGDGKVIIEDDIEKAMDDKNGKDK